MREILDPPMTDLELTKFRTEKMDKMLAEEKSNKELRDLISEHFIEICRMLEIFKEQKQFRVETLFGDVIFLPTKTND